MRYNDLPLSLLLLFTIIYALKGNPNNEIWSGMYFIVNYCILLIMFFKEQSKVNRVSGIALSISMLIFIVLKYFLGLNIEKIWILVTLILALILIIYLESGKHKR